IALAHVLGSPLPASPSLGLPAGLCFWMNSLTSRAASSAVIPLGKTKRIGLAASAFAVGASLVGIATVLSGCRHNYHRGAYGKGRRPIQRRFQPIRPER